MNDLRTLFEKYKGNATTLIETGTYNGAGVKNALTAGFANIYSFEISKDLVEKAHKMFRDKLNIVVFNESSSGETFKKLCQSLTEPCVFWLDAHKMGGGGKIPEDYPLIEELKAIGQSNIAHTVLMDDFRLFGRYGVTIDDVTGLLYKEGLDFKVVKETVRDKYPNDVLCFIPKNEVKQ